MKISFRWKLISVFLAVIFFSMMALTLLSSVLLKPIFIMNSKRTMIEYSKKISINLSEDEDVIYNILEEVNQAHGIYVDVLNKKGKIIGPFLKKRSLSEQKNYRYIEMYNKSDKKDNYFFNIRTDENSNEKKLIFISKSENGNYIVMKKAVKGLEQDVNIVSIFILIMGCTIAVAGTIVWSVFAKSVADTMKKMSRITQRMSKLNFDEKINHKSMDEIGVLAESIDVLSEKLENSIDSLKKDIEHRKRLVRDISHELKTPITTIEGYIESIQVNTKDNEKIQKYCKIATEECDEISSLVEEMLETSRMESEEYVCKMELINVEKIAHLIKNKTDAEYHLRNISISFEHSEILCNDILISRAIMNYVKNAVNYGEKDKEIKILGSIQGEKYAFSVVNEGTEIAEDEKLLLWDLFYKKDKSRRRDSSHGIGLSMVKRIAEIHNGDVGVTSEGGRNTFNLYIPLKNNG